MSSLWLLVVASFFIEIMTLLWGPAKDASVPHFVPEDKLASANTLSLVASYGTFPIGAAIAAALAVVATWLGGFDALSSLKVDKNVVSLWFDAITYVLSAILVFRLPIPKPARDGTKKLDFASSIREIKDGIRFMRGEAFSRAVIVGLGGGLIGAGAMIPLGTVFASEVLGSEAQYGVMLTALGTGAAIGIFIVLALQKKLPRDELFGWSVIGVGVFLFAGVAFNVGGIAALFIAATGACAASAYVTGFTLIQEHVSDEMRGRHLRHALRGRAPVSAAVVDGVAAVRRPVRLALRPREQLAARAARRVLLQLPRGAAGALGRGRAHDRVRRLRAPAGAAVPGRARRRRRRRPAGCRRDERRRVGPTGTRRGVRRDRPVRGARGRRRFGQVDAVHAASPARSRHAATTWS